MAQYYEIVQQDELKNVYPPLNIDNGFQLVMGDDVQFGSQQVILSQEQSNDIQLVGGVYQTRQQIPQQQQQQQQQLQLQPPQHLQDTTYLRQVNSSLPADTSYMQQGMHAPQTHLQHQQGTGTGTIQQAPQHVLTHHQPAQVILQNQGTAQLVQSQEPQQLQQQQQPEQPTMQQVVYDQHGMQQQQHQTVPLTINQTGGSAVQQHQTKPTQSLQQIQLQHVPQQQRLQLGKNAITITTPQHSQHLQQQQGSTMHLQQSGATGTQIFPGGTRTCFILTKTQQQQHLGGGTQIVTSQQQQQQQQTVQMQTNVVQQSTLIGTTRAVPLQHQQQLKPDAQQQTQIITQQKVSTGQFTQIGTVAPTGDSLLRPRLTRPRNAKPANPRQPRSGATTIGTIQMRGPRPPITAQLISTPIRTSVATSTTAGGLNTQTTQQTVFHGIMAGRN
uniref:Uncharacterized protein n=1 Tax=Anopheles culicifacies TaxID=139723 RepID=A0A182MFT2_9DIPT